jgi:hypothetical protein
MTKCQTVFKSVETEGIRTRVERKKNEIKDKMRNIENEQKWGFWIYEVLLVLTFWQRGKGENERGSD